jgi:acetyl esterase/lipase
MADPSEVLDRAAPGPTMTLRYGPLPDHVADVWLPAADLVPLTLVVVVHGGFWRAAFDRKHVRPMSNALVAQGFSVAAIEFRRTGMPGGGWPGTVEDVRTALTRLPDLLAAQAPAGRPIRSVVVVGHSAGGHLALWAGSQVKVPGLVGVISLAGVLDLVRADELRLGAQGDDGAVAAFLGGRAHDRPDDYAAADPSQLAPPPVPVALVHGVLDTVVPIELSHRYADYARSLGADVEVTDLAGIEHFGVIDPLSPAWGAVLGALDRLTHG